MTTGMSRRTRWAVAVAALTVAALLLIPGLVRGTGFGVGKGDPATTSRADPHTSPDQQIAALQQRLRDKPQDFDAHITLAGAYLQRVRETGDPALYTKAAELLDRAEKLDAQHPELFATRGLLALARHDFADALRRGKQALVLEPDSARYHGIVGDAQIELGHYEAALASYQAMVDRRPDFGSFSRVAHARELYGDPEGAIQALHFALTAGSTQPENTAWAHVQLGNLRFETGQLDEAAREYALSLRTLEGYPPALAGQARVAAARGDLAGAAGLYQRAFDRMPVPEYAILLGDVYAKQGDGQKAAEQYALVRTIDTLFRANGVNTDLELALFFADHDLDLPASLAKARAAYGARPSIHAADALAWTLYKTGSYEEARQYAAAALKLGTRDALKLFHAGMIEQALGDDAAARRYFEEALHINPHFSLLHAPTRARRWASRRHGEPAGGGEGWETGGGAGHGGAGRQARADGRGADQVSDGRRGRLGQYVGHVLRVGAGRRPAPPRHAAPRAGGSRRGECGVSLRGRRDRPRYPRGERAAGRRRRARLDRRGVPVGRHGPVARRGDRGGERAGAARWRAAVGAGGRPVHPRGRDQERDHGGGEDDALLAGPPLAGDQAGAGVGTAVRASPIAAHRLAAPPVGVARDDCAASSEQCAAGTSRLVRALGRAPGSRAPDRDDGDEAMTVGKGRAGMTVARRRLARMALLAILLAVAGALGPADAAAHPLGNFTINHYSRVEFADGAARILYVLDLAEIPTFQQLGRLDTDGDGALSDAWRPPPTSMPSCRPSCRACG